MADDSSHSESPARMQTDDVKELCGTTPIDVVPAKNYAQLLWDALDQTVDHSGMGSESASPSSLGPSKFRFGGPFVASDNSGMRQLSGSF